MQEPDEPARFLPIHSGLRDGNIEAAIIHQPIAGEAIGRRLRQAGVPSCYFFHSPWAREFQIQTGIGSPGGRLRYHLRHTIEGRALRSFSRVIVFSQTMTDLLQTDHPGVPAPVRVTPGINLERFHPSVDRTASRNRLMWPESGTILLTVRRLVPRMGVDMLIQ
ncbi:glycosyltransferase, partial [Gemmatimonadota bacterium]